MNELVGVTVGIASETAERRRFSYAGEVSTMFDSSAGCPVSAPLLASDDMHAVQGKQRTNNVQHVGRTVGTASGPNADSGYATVRLTEPCPACQGLMHRVPADAAMLAAEAAGRDWLGSYVCSQGGTARVSARRVP
jgi:hypothetical protein